MVRLCFRPVAREEHVPEVPGDKQSYCQDQCIMSSSYVRDSDCAGCAMSNHWTSPADPRRQQEEVKVPANNRRHTQVTSMTLCSVDIEW